MNNSTKTILFFNKFQNENKSIASFMNDSSCKRKLNTYKKYEYLYQPKKNEKFL